MVDIKKSPEESLRGINVPPLPWETNPEATREDYSNDTAVKNLIKLGEAMDSDLIDEDIGALSEEEEEEEQEARQKKPAKKKPVKDTDDAQEKEEEHEEHEGDEYLDQDEDEDEGEEDEEDEDKLQDKKFEVLVNGQQEKVTLKELLNGYQRQSDYTRKTQDVARERGKLNDLYAQTDLERKKYAKALEQISKGIEDSIERYKFINWGDMTDGERAERQVQYNELQNQSKQFKELLSGLDAEAQQARQRVTTEMVQEETYKLANHPKTQVLFPELTTNPVKGSEYRAGLNAYGISQGFTQEEMNQLVDHRVLLELRKAQLWTESQSRNPAKTVKTISKKKGIQNKIQGKRSGKTRGNPKKVSGLVDRFNKTRSEDDAQNLLAAILD